MHTEPHRPMKKLKTPEEMQALDAHRVALVGQYVAGDTVMLQDLPIGGTFCPISWMPHSQHWSYNPGYIWRKLAEHGHNADGSRNRYHGSAMVLCQRIDRPEIDGRWICTSHAKVMDHQSTATP